MFTKAQVDFIQSVVERTLGMPVAGHVTVSQGTGVTVAATPGEAVLTAESLPALARCFFRLQQERKAGREIFTLHEEKNMDSCGCFLDFSRNGVMTVEACKRYMEACACLGMNLMVLYTEDTFTVPEYPYMGYLRGRYTPEELKALDDYAAALGMELVPCIQTLGHLEQFLQWRANTHLQDQPAVLMADDEGSYAFIEAEIRAVRQCVRTKRLHIGMDEAHGVGLGRYYAAHGAVDRFSLLSRHL